MGENVIIFGGSFNPIHNGHLTIAKKALDTYGGVLYFVLAKKPRWKSDVLHENHRLAMLNLAIKESGQSNFLVDDYELLSEESVNYTIDTVRYFKDKFKNKNLIILIGDDQVAKFDEWRDPFEIARLAKIVYYRRCEDERVDKNAKKFQMEELKGNLLDVSSSAIRNISDLNVPFSVFQYMYANKLYKFADLTNYIEEKRIKHSYEVAKLSYQVMAANGLVDKHRALLAGILHDIGKKCSGSGKLMKKYYRQYLDLPRYSFHQYISSFLAQKDFFVTDKLVLDAIECHTTGKANMTYLDKILYACDKIEPTRKFDSSELIKAMVDDYESGFVTVLKANKEFLKADKSNNRLSRECFSAYLSEKSS